MTDHGKYWDEAWNTVIGCTKCSPGCLNCWAENLHNQRLEAYYNGKKMPKQYTKLFRQIQLLPDRLDKPLHWRKPRTIFVNNIGDTFHPSVPFEFIEKIFDVMYKAKWHKYLLLTKRPDRMKQVWWDTKSLPYMYLGTTICNQAEADKNIPTLLQIPGKRWLSIEPMLGPIVFPEDKLFCDRDPEEDSPVATVPCLCGKHWQNGFTEKVYRLECFDWVVVGCESGPNRRPCKIEDMISVVEQCKAAGVSVFVKQISQRGKVEKDMSKFPVALQVRQKVSD